MDFVDQAQPHGIVVALGPQNAAAGNVLAMTTTSAQTAALADKGLVDITATAACFIEIGLDPTAVINTSYYIVADLPYRLVVDKGNKIAARTVTGAGSLYYHPVA